MALVASPAGAASPPQISLITGFQGTATVTVGHPKPAASAQISPTFASYIPATGDQIAASTNSGATFVYLIAGANSVSGEYGIPGGALIPGDAYLVAGNGTAGLVADPGGSATPLATDNSISPTSVAFDNNGNLVIAGSFGSGATSESATQVVAKTTGTFYGVAMTAGNLYTVAGVGLTGMPSTALPYPVGIAGYGVGVDSQGNIIIGSGGEVYMINEQATPVTRYGTTVPAHTVQLISGSGGGLGTCAPPASLPTQGSGTSYLQFPNPSIDANGNIFINDNQVPVQFGAGSGCVWLVPAQTGTAFGQSVVAGNMYPVAGNGGTTATSTSGISATSANVSTTSATSLDPAGNLLLASQGQGVNGTLPALQVVAATTGNYYSQNMTAGDIYTLAGGTATGTTIPGAASAFGLAGPTSLASDGLGNLFMTDGATASANLYEVTGGPTGPVAQPPTVTSINPSSGPEAGGTTVTITGTKLTGATAVAFGANPATNVTVNSATSVTAHSPAGTGTVNVTVTTPVGTSTGTAGQFTYNAPNTPTVTSINPTSGTSLGGTSVTITGTNLTGATAVNFGANPATNVTVVSATSVTATSPAGTGTVNVTVTTPNGTSTGNAGQFTYVVPAPTVTSINPTSGTSHGGTSVTITGTNLTGATAVNFGTNPATNVTVVSPTSVTATSPAGTGTVNVTVTTPGGTSTGNAGQFTYVVPAPAVTSINPTSGPQAGGTSVTITGTNLTGATAVHFGANAATGVVVNSATSVTAIAPAGTGTVNVTVTTPGGTSPGTAGQFTYVAPTAPAAPTNVIAAPGNGQASVSWTAPANGGSPITGYTVTGTPGGTCTTTGATSCTVTGLTNGTAYTFTVTATNTVGTGPASSPSNSVTPAVPTAQGYWEVGADGGIFTFGDAGFFGSMGGMHLNAPVVGMAATSDGQGYWEVASDGGIFTFGDAGFFGSEGGMHLNKPVVGMAATADGQGYWLVASDGGVFAFGDATFFGSKGGMPLNKPVVGMAATPDGQGYWLVASDGGIFTFGDATFFGSKGGMPLNRPVVGMAAAGANGYWLVASDGGIFAFGSATFLGSKGGQPLNAPVIGVAATNNHQGYWLGGADGGIFTFGNAGFLGSQGGMPLNAPVVGLAATPHPV
jgi:hypothetical protein